MKKYQLPTKEAGLNDIKRCLDLFFKRSRKLLPPALPPEIFEIRRQVNTSFGGKLDVMLHMQSQMLVTHYSLTVLFLDTRAEKVWSIFTKDTGGDLAAVRQGLISSIVTQLGDKIDWKNK